MFASPADALPSLTAALDLREVAVRYFDAEFLARAAAYHRVRLILFFVDIGLVLALLWWWAGRLWSPRGKTVAARALALAVVFGGITVVRLPVSVIRYLHATRYELRHDGLGAFLLDWTKGAGLGLLQVELVGLCVLGAYAAWGRRWWLRAGALVGVLAAAYAFLAPLLIDPIFNRIEPMAPGPLTEEVLRVTRDGGVPAETVWVADASRRTRAVNAYFTGFGPSRRIVLYDNLIDKLDREEVLLVVAHEVGHWRRHHLYTGLVLGLAAAVIGLALGGRVLDRWRERRGVARNDPALAAVAYALFWTVMLAALPAVNAVSRVMETQADASALELTGNPDAFIRAKVRGAEENLGNVAPPRWVEVVFFTHPATARRIAMAEAAS